MSSLDDYLSALEAELMRARVQGPLRRVAVRGATAVLPAAAIVIAGVAAIGALGGTGEREGPSPAAGPPAVRDVAPGALLAPPRGGAPITPYMAVACPRAHTIPCDRVGLAVTLRRPAVAVTAAIGGRRFALDDPRWSGPVRHGTRTHFAGFVNLHVRATARVTIVVTRSDGTRERTTLPVARHPGWG